jgi:hemoglobin/transferrin/lactoferrin receptor protein
MFRWTCGPLFCLLAAASPEAVEVDVESDLTGTARDRSSAVLVGARVEVLTPQQAVVATATTDQQGKFTITGLPDGQYLVVVRYPSLADRTLTVTITGPTTAPLDVVLDVAPLGQDVTVTGSPGLLGDLATLSQPVNVITAEGVLERAKTVVAQAVEGETAVNLQRTSPGMAGVFVRGLTGNKVNVFIDGVRFSNGAQRGGVNTFLDLIDPSVVDRIEVLRGTSSAQYGSDALGGSVQFLSNVPTLSSTKQPVFGGVVTLGGESAHPGGVGGLSLSYAREGFGLWGSASGRKTGDYRPGGGNDSHAAVLRFLGVPSETLYPARMPDTGFHQAATQLRANWIPASDVLLTANYVHTRQNGANRWDQLLGGDGNLIAELNDLQLDLFYVRLESLRAGWFDRASLTYSFNSQREERVNQGGNGNPNATISHEPERTTVNGVQVNASRQLSARSSLLVGGDLYLEALTSDAYDQNPTTGAISVRRPRVPSGATYHQSGVFAQTNLTAVPNRLVVSGAMRVGFNEYTARAADAPVVNGKPLWPDDHLRTTSVTYRAGLTYTPAPAWALTTAIGTGYRAPHMTDLGTLGLTGSGFEVAAPDLAGRPAFVGTTADSAAKSTGRPVEQVTPETSVNVDAAVRYQTQKVRASVGAFVNSIDGNIQKVALILPPGAVGTTIGGETITAQTADGAVFVAASSNPVLVRANFDNARIWGIETNGEVTMTPRTTVGGTFTYLRATDTATGQSPNIEGGTPAPGGWVWARYMASEGRWWVQPYLMFAGEQTHLSTLDLSDRRTGASRSRTNIQNFFRNGARARGWIAPGPDGVFGNADDVLMATGETLVQIQDRVLGAGVSSAPLYTAVAGYAAFGVRVGWQFGSHGTLFVDAENLGDANYRGISWGMDAPGIGVTARYVFRF